MRNQFKYDLYLIVSLKERLGTPGLGTSQVQIK